MFRLVVLVLCDDKAYVCPVRTNLYLGDDPLLALPAFRLVVQFEIPSYDYSTIVTRSLGLFNGLFEVVPGTLPWLVNHVQKPCVSTEAGEVAYIPFAKEFPYPVKGLAVNIVLQPCHCRLRAQVFVRRTAPHG